MKNFTLRNGLQYSTNPEGVQPCVTMGAAHGTPAEPIHSA